MTDQATLSDVQYARLASLLSAPSYHLKIPSARWSEPGCPSTTRAAPGAVCRVSSATGHTIYVLRAHQPLGQERHAGTHGASAAAGTAARVHTDALSLDRTLIHLHMHGLGARRTGARPMFKPEAG